MTDARLRSLERAAGDDPAAAAALVAERIRLQSFDGARDPRVDPRRRDEIERRAARKSGQALSRWVTYVWPRALVRELPYSIPYVYLRGSAPRLDVPWLPVGAQVLWVTLMRSHQTDWGRVEDLWHMGVRLRPGAEVAEVAVADHPDLSDDLAPGCAVERVTWRSESVQAGREQHSDVAAWRRWARGGRVVRVGS